MKFIWTMFLLSWLIGVVFGFRVHKKYGKNYKGTLKEFFLEFYSKSVEVKILFVDVIVFQVCVALIAISKII